MEAFDARAYLQSLAGQTISTITGRPNTVVAVQGDEALVRTIRNEGAESDRVPIQWVQEAADDLFARGEIGINVKEASYRSAFVGAVLASIPEQKLCADQRGWSSTAVPAPVATPLPPMAFG